MELVILFGVAAWWVLAGPVLDVEAARRGELSARRREREAERQRRHEARMVRERRREGPTLAEALATRLITRVSTPRSRARGPAKTYLANVWGDAWGRADERRATYGDRRERGDLPRQRAARFAGRVADAIGEQARTDQRRVRDARRRARARRDGWGPPPSPEEYADPWIDPYPTPAPPPSSSRRRREPPSDSPTVEVEVPVVREHAERTDRPPHVPDPPRKRAAIEPPAPSLASVHPIRGETVTELSTAETLNPEAALAYARGVEHAGHELGERVQTIVTNTEQSIANLTTRGVSGEPIAHFQRVMEAANAAQTAMETLSSESAGAAGYFERHVGAADQYRAARQQDGMGDSEYAEAGS